MERLWKILRLVSLPGMVATLMGCMSDRAARERGESIASPLNIIARSLSGSQDLAYATAAFARKNDRWPKDYAELSSFVERSDGLLLLGQYDRVDFIDQPEGGLEICAVIQGRTNRMTFTSKDAGTK